MLTTFRLPLSSRSSPSGIVHIPPVLTRHLCVSVLLLWSHYADGQRGIAIGLRINNSEYDVRAVQYNGLAYIQDRSFNHNTATEILTHKLEVWSYEEEERVFVRDQHFVNVTIKKIVTGRRMSNANVSLIRGLIEKINPNIEIIRADNLME